MPSNIPISATLNYADLPASGFRMRSAVFVLALTALFAPSRVQGLALQEKAAGVERASSGTATLRGVVRGSDTHALAGAAVFLSGKNAHALIAHTDTNGSYRFVSVRPGSYTVRAEMAGYTGATSSPFNLEKKESRTIDLTLESAKTPEPKHSSADRPEFFDEPHFTVAGVTDTTSLGGHGSDSVVRNREALAKATASLGNTHNDTDDYERARAAIRALLAEQAKAGQEQAETHHSLAEADERLGDSLEAVKEYQRAAELNPSEGNLFDWGAELLLHRAAEPAIEVFTKGNRLFPKSVRMLTGLGASWYALGSFEQAARRLCEASDLNPDDPNPYLFMGKMQSAETTQSEAMAERLERFVRLLPQNAMANYYYAVSLWQRRKSPEEIEGVAQVKSLLEKAVHLDPKLGLAYLQLGILYSERRDFSRAIAAYQQAVEAAPRLEEAHYRLAQAYRQSGETTKAQAELQLYSQISKEKTDETERQRHELQQFVYQLRDGMPAPHAQ